jgi:uncharacterized membrane protein
MKRNETNKRRQTSASAVLALMLSTLVLMLSTLVLVTLVPGCEAATSGESGAGGWTSYALTLTGVESGASYSADVYSSDMVMQGGGMAKAANGRTSVKITLTPDDDDEAVSFFVPGRQYIVILSGSATVDGVSKTERRELRDFYFNEGGGSNTATYPWTATTFVSRTLAGTTGGASVSLVLSPLAVTTGAAVSSASGASGVETFNYSLSVDGTEVSKGTAEEGGSEWTFTPITGEVWTASVSGGFVSIGELAARFVTPDPVTETPTYGITLGKSGTHTFTPVTGAGYAAPAALAVTVSNTGNQPTGDLNAALSGGGSCSFVLSSPVIDSIAVGGTDAFTVTPKTGLATGTYSATVTVSGGNGIEAGFNVAFTVSDSPVFGITLDATGTHTFPAVTAGYGAQTAKTVNISNTGNQPTGNLTIILSSSAAFTLSRTAVNSIAVGGTEAFTVTPKTDLSTGTYGATVTVRGGSVISKSFGVSWTVNPPATSPVYGIALSETGTHTFPADTAGYGAQTARSVTITNTGNQPTGSLSLSLSSGAAFTLSRTAVNSIAVGGTDAFTVTPKTGLAAGTYSATVTASGDSVTSKSFGVSWTVNPAPTYGIALSETGTHTFTAATEGYGAQTAKSVTISNSGNQPTGSLTIDLSSGAAFTLSQTAVNSIAAGGTDAFTVTPKTGLDAGTYSATVTVSGGSNVTSKSFSVGWTVNPAPVYGIALSETGTHTFPAATAGYGAQTAKSVTISNSGNQPTGSLSLSLSSSAAFTLSRTAVNSIGVGGTDTFTVTPNTGLSAGSYSATVTVSGGSVTSKSFVVSWTVNAALESSVSSSVVRKLFTSAQASETVSLSGLSGNTVYLVKVNKGSGSVSAGNSGSVAASSGQALGIDTLGADTLGTISANTLDILDTLDTLNDEAAANGGRVSGRFTATDGQTVTRYELPREGRVGAGAFVKRSASASSSSGVLRSVSGAAAAPSVLASQYAVGNTKTFWGLNASSNFVSVSATLRASGTHGNVWVADSNYSTSSASKDNKITLAQANAIATKFDLIYEAETPLFGFEYGGGLAASDPDYGGADGDPKIQILVYDIYGDYKTNQTGGVFGYFYDVDEYSQSELGNSAKSNEAEIFFIDAHFTDISPDGIYSTLAHEFQHMINFNVKGVEQGLEAGVWYNEMLSMLAEDVIDPLIGIPATNSGHPIKSRIPDFLGYYNTAAPTVWQTGNSVYYSYANSYAFGAYLARNFGGAALIREIMENDAVDQASVTAALASTANPLRSQVAGFDDAIRRYGEALVFSQTAGTRPEGVLSFNNTVTDTVNGKSYTFSGFDIWNIANNNNRTLGPKVFDAGTTTALPAGTMLLQTKSAWKDVTGGFTITVNKPASNNVEVYVMVK